MKVPSLSKLLFSFILFFQNSFRKFYKHLAFANSRSKAHRLRKELIKKNGTSVVTKEIKRIMKNYAQNRFGKSSFWPYLALYTEVRGEYMDGWMPFDYYKFVLLPKINPLPAASITGIKTFVHRLFNDFAITPLFCYISGMFFKADMQLIKDEEVKDFLNNYNDILVIKEEGGRGGKQVNFVKPGEFDFNMLKKNKNYVIQPHIKQYKALQDLYPHSVNTFRVTTYFNNGGDVRVLFVVLRFGLDGSKVDNVSSGGNFLFFELDGSPNSQAINALGLNIGERHKNTGYLFSDLHIPAFEYMLEKCKTAHKSYPYVRLIGWDVCINFEGEPKLIECNSCEPGFSYYEAKFGPFFTDNIEQNF